MRDPLENLTNDLLGAVPDWTGGMHVNCFVALMRKRPETACADCIELANEGGDDA